MIKLVERHLCDLCNAEIEKYAGRRNYYICKRETCDRCHKSYSFAETGLQGYTCSQCQTVLHKESRVKEALNTFLQQWKLFSIRERDLSTNP